MQQFGALFTASEFPAAWKVSSRSALGHCSFVTGHSMLSRGGGALQSEKSCRLRRWHHFFYLLKITGFAHIISELTFLHHWGFWCHCRVGELNVAGEVGLAVGQVFVEQATDVAWEHADLGTIPERCVLLLVWVGGVKESLAVRILAKWFWWLRRECIFAVHPEVVLIYWAVV